jgi:hypothetical protein
MIKRLQLVKNNLTIAIDIPLSVYISIISLILTKVY